MTAIEFKKFLGRVYLGGLIDRVLIKTENGKSEINTSDIADSILAFSSINFESNLPEEVGLSQIGKLCTLLGHFKNEELNIKFNKNRISLGFGADILTVLPDMIPSVIDDIEPIKKLTSTASVSFELTKKMIDDCQAFISWSGSPDISFNIKGNEIYISGGSETDNKFNYLIHKIESVEKKLKKEKKKETLPDFSVLVYADRLSAIFNVLEFGDKPIFIYLAKEVPVVIVQDVDNGWALNPIVQQKGE
jgi:hypothetical protein